MFMSTDSTATSVIDGNNNSFSPLGPISGDFAYGSQGHDRYSEWPRHTS